MSVSYFNDFDGFIRTIQQLYRGCSSYTFYNRVLTCPYVWTPRGSDSQVTGSPSCEWLLHKNRLCHHVTYFRRVLVDDVDTFLVETLVSELHRAFRPMAIPRGCHLRPFKPASYIGSDAGPLLPWPGAESYDFERSGAGSLPSHLE